MANPLRQHLLLPPTGLGTGRPAPGPVTEEQTRQMEGQGTHKQPLFEEEPAWTRGTSPRADRGGRRSRGAAADATDTDTDTPHPTPPQASPSPLPGNGRVIFTAAAVPLFPLALYWPWAGPWLAARLKASIQRRQGGGQFPLLLVAAEEGRALAAAGVEAEGALQLALSIPGVS